MPLAEWSEGVSSVAEPLLTQRRLWTMLAPWSEIFRSGKGCPSDAGNRLPSVRLTRSLGSDVTGAAKQVDNAVPSVSLKVFVYGLVLAVGLVFSGAGTLFWMLRGQLTGGFSRLESSVENIDGRVREVEKKLATIEDALQAAKKATGDLGQGVAAAATARKQFEVKTKSMTHQ